MSSASAANSKSSKKEDKKEGERPPPKLLASAGTGQLLSRISALKGAFNETQAKELALLVSDVLNCLRSDSKIAITRSDAIYDGVALRATHEASAALKIEREKKILNLLHLTTGDEFPDLKAARKVYKIPGILFQNDSYGVTGEINPSLLSGTKFKDGFTKASN
jgi:hypothetical protein